MNICVITFPVAYTKNGGSMKVIMSNFLEILGAISDNIFVITSSFLVIDPSIRKIIRITKIDTTKESSKSAAVKIIQYINYQYKVCRELLRISNNIDIVFMYGGSSLLLPNLAAHVLRKKVYIFAQGPDFEATRITYPPLIGSILYLIVKAIDKINWMLADKVVIESKSMIISEEMELIKNKVDSRGARYIDIEKFNIKKEYKERKKTVAYIGRLECGKGVMEFVKAIFLLNSSNPDINFFIGGDGKLSEEIISYLKMNDELVKTELIGWISHDQLPRYLNQLKLLVLPSSFEGLPTIVLESMSCGTPVLATSVGGIPDIIKNEKTGFILDNNSPKCIARNINAALNHANLEQISINARELIEKEFTFKAAVERFTKILEEI